MSKPTEISPTADAIDASIAGLNQGRPSGQASAPWFAVATTEEIVSAITPLMAPSGQYGQMWKHRAIAMLNGVVRALVWLRDEKGHPLDAPTIRDHLRLPNLFELAYSPHRHWMPEPIRRSIRSLLTSLPGFDENASEQSIQTVEQHAYLEIQLVEPLEHLSTTMHQDHRIDTASYFASPTDFMVGTGSPEKVIAMLVESLDDKDGEGTMWTGRAKAMLEGAVRAACWLRDEGGIDLDADALKGSLELRSLIDLADPEIHPAMPHEIRTSLLRYLNSLPGFDAIKGHAQYQTTQDNHGYLSMQFAKILETPTN